MLSAVGLSLGALLVFLTHPQGDPIPERLRQIAGPDAAQFYLDHIAPALAGAWTSYWGSTNAYLDWLASIAQPFSA